MRAIRSLPSRVGAFCILIGLAFSLFSFIAWVRDYFSDAYFDHSPPYFYANIPAVFFLYFGIRLQFGKPIGSYCRLVGWLVFPLALVLWACLWSAFHPELDFMSLGNVVLFLTVLAVCPVYAFVTRLVMKIDGIDRRIATKELFSRSGIRVLAVFFFLTVSGVMEVIIPVPYPPNSNDGMLAAVSLCAPIALAFLFYWILLSVVGDHEVGAHGKTQGVRK